MPELLTAIELAKELRCCTATVRRWTNEGRMPKDLRVGRLARWSRESIDQWIADGCPNLNEGDADDA